MKGSFNKEQWVVSFYLFDSQCFELLTIMLECELTLSWHNKN